MGRDYLGNIEKDIDADLIKITDKDKAEIKKHSEERRKKRLKDPKYLESIERAKKVTPSSLR